jgi:NAD-dependent SIR2 family protein deacetylase
MRWKIISVAAIPSPVCSIAVAFGAGVGGEDGEKELRKLQGTWFIISAEREAKKVADEHIKQSNIIYNGSKMEVITPHRPRDDKRLNFSSKRHRVWRLSLVDLSPDRLI